MCPFFKNLFFSRSVSRMIDKSESSQLEPYRYHPGGSLAVRKSRWFAFGSRHSTPSSQAQWAAAASTVLLTSLFAYFFSSSPFSGDDLLDDIESFTCSEGYTQNVNDKVEKVYYHERKTRIHAYIKSMIACIVQARVITTAIRDHLISKALSLSRRD